MFLFGSTLLDCTIEEGRFDMPYIFGARYAHRGSLKDNIVHHKEKDFKNCFYQVYRV